MTVLKPQTEEIKMTIFGHVNQILVLFSDYQCFLKASQVILLCSQEPLTWFTLLLQRNEYGSSEI